MQQEVSPSPLLRKERVLKTWRRIKKEVNKGADNCVDTGRITTLVFGIQCRIPVKDAIFY